MRASSKKARAACLNLSQSGEVLLPVRSVFDWFVSLCGCVSWQHDKANADAKLEQERNDEDFEREDVPYGRNPMETVQNDKSNYSQVLFVSLIYVIVYFSSVSCWMKLTNCKFPLIKTYLVLYEAGWPSALPLPCSFLFLAN